MPTAAELTRQFRITRPVHGRSNMIDRATGEIVAMLQRNDSVSPDYWGRWQVRICREVAIAVEYTGVRTHTTNSRTHAVEWVARIIGGNA